MPRKPSSRPMVTVPPIEGNSHCRARPFHFKLYFDLEVMRQQPKLRDSFRLLQRGESILDALFRISRASIWATSLDYGSLLHFEEKFKEELQKPNYYVVSELLCHILEHMGYPMSPTLSAATLSRVIHFDKWTQLASYLAPPVPP
ncbi:hypothetical protein CK203_098124 [Vitis vinifera]|uniref:Uncharacterized protein n=1 Tax=Vitis vinifera TaxID=29760 RepID=A0A438C649_VITVI|nr:hypothetical protein CK203_098124 [Vitis vinifera]